VLSRFFLDRPVFAWVIAIILMLAGALAIYSLPVSQYPPIAPPSIAIDAFYPGASAKTVEDSVTQIIEQRMTGFDRLLYLSASSSSSGASRVELTFAPGTDPDIAWSQVQNKLQLAMPNLPSVIQQQGVKVSKSTRNYLLIVNLYSADGSMSGVDVRDYATSNIEKVLSRVPGVGEVNVFGGQYAMRVWFDTEKLTNYGLTIDLGNFLCVNENPTDATRRLAKYVIMAHAKDFHVKPKSQMPPSGWFATPTEICLRGAIAGHGVLDLPAQIKLLKRAGYNGFLSLEFEGMEEPTKGVTLGLKYLKPLL
jgi:Cu/Ag efflux pump CusA